MSGQKASKISSKRSASHGGKGKEKSQEKASLGRPLEGVRIFMDIQNKNRIGELSKQVERLGGKIEEFLSKDVSWIVTSQKFNEGNGESWKYDTLPSPLSIPSPHQNITTGKKNFSCGSRGKDLILKSIESKRGAVTISDVTEKARRVGAKLISFEVFTRRYLKKSSVEDTDYKYTTKKRISSDTTGKSMRHLSISRVPPLKLIEPFVKIEIKSRQYKPIFYEIRKWPAIYHNGRKRGCPFEVPGDGCALAKDKSQCDLEQVYPSVAERSDENASGKVKGDNQKDKKDNKAGNIKHISYCDCCNVRYVDLKKHVKSEKHRAFARNKENYKELDQLIGQSTPFVNFLQDLRSFTSKTTKVNNVSRDRSKANQSSSKTLQPVDNNRCNRSDGELYSKAVKLDGLLKTQSGKGYAMPEVSVKDNFANVSAGNVPKFQAGLSSYLKDLHPTCERNKKVHFSKKAIEETFSYDNEEKKLPASNHKVILGIRNSKEPSEKFQQTDISKVDMHLDENQIKEFEKEMKLDVTSNNLIESGKQVENCKYIIEDSIEELVENSVEYIDHSDTSQKISNELNIETIEVKSGKSSQKCLVEQEIEKSVKAIIDTCLNTISAKIQLLEDSNTSEENKFLGNEKGTNLISDKNKAHTISVNTEQLDVKSVVSLPPEKETFLNLNKRKEINELHEQILEVQGCRVPFNVAAEDVIEIEKKDDVNTVIKHRDQRNGKPIPTVDKVYPNINSLCDMSIEPCKFDMLTERERVPLKSAVVNDSLVSSNLLSEVNPILESTCNEKESDSIIILEGEHCRMETKQEADNDPLETSTEPLHLDVHLVCDIEQIFSFENDKSMDSQAKTENEGLPIICGTREKAASSSVKNIVVSSNEHVSLVQPVPTFINVNNSNQHKGRNLSVISISSGTDEVFQVNSDTICQPQRGEIATLPSTPILSKERSCHLENTNQEPDGCMQMCVSETRSKVYSKLNLNKESSDVSEVIKLTLHNAVSSTPCKKLRGTGNDLDFSSQSSLNLDFGVLEYSAAASEKIKPVSTKVSKGSKENLSPICPKTITNDPALFEEEETNESCEIDRKEEIFLISEEKLLRKTSAKVCRGVNKDLISNLIDRIEKTPKGQKKCFDTGNEILDFRSPSCATANAQFSRTNLSLQKCTSDVLKGMGKVCSGKKRLDFDKVMPPNGAINDKKCRGKGLDLTDLSDFLSDSDDELKLSEVSRKLNRKDMFTPESETEKASHKVTDKSLPTLTKCSKSSAKSIGDDNKENDQGGDDDDVFEEESKTKNEDEEDIDDDNPLNLSYRSFIKLRGRRGSKKEKRKSVSQTPELNETRKKSRNVKDTAIEVPSRTSNSTKKSTTKKNLIKDNLSVLSVTDCSNVFSTSPTSPNSLKSTSLSSANIKQASSRRTKKLSQDNKQVSGNASKIKSRPTKSSNDVIQTCLSPTTSTQDVADVESFLESSDSKRTKTKKKRAYSDRITNNESIISVRTTPIRAARKTPEAGSLNSSPEAIKKKRYLDVTSRDPCGSKSLCNTLNEDPIKSENDSPSSSIFFKSPTRVRTSSAYRVTSKLKNKANGNKKSTSKLKSKEIAGHNVIKFASGKQLRKNTSHRSNSSNNSSQLSDLFDFTG